jgi:methyl coenzyme M reductase gamma subunit
MVALTGSEIADARLPDGMLETQAQPAFRSRAGVSISRDWDELRLSLREVGEIRQTP